MKSIRNFKAFIKVIAFAVIILLVSGCAFSDPNTIFRGSFTGFAAMLQTKRNVTLFCSKAYFDKMYADIKKETLKSPFQFDFYASQNPDDFFVAGFENNRLVLFYTNSKKFAGVQGIKIGSTLKSIKSLKLKPLTQFEIKGEGHIYTFTDERLGKDYDALLFSNAYYVFIFYDRLANPSVVNGIFMVKKSIWDDFLISDSVLLKQKTPGALVYSFERLSYLHLNSVRASLKKSLFKYSEKISSCARLHSQNMAKYNFFGHTDVFGQSPADRFKKQGILFKRMGENIAMGEKLLPFFANHLLLNSPGHRENIEENFEYAGIGCAIDSKTENVYYTQNFANLLN
ncbi:CAP domain-containing protein [Caldicellulosiruptor morganii]|uniref:CAP domain-containing protein n=1 Tax=Caldicellulosiruptor morganii TaxID=1387555 RepID=A0ABY7BNF1_9FIRM|nr:CAP domain-containing protein [Caldicellulosiruptor morganii]WAM33847.1 CAP domain-containing protein [Caldicellulosiruptor morganii]